MNLFRKSQIPKDDFSASRKILLFQGAVASSMLALTTGNFMSGYFSWLGASPSFIARIAAIPQMGCVLQMISPVFVETKKYRKPWIVGICFLFRFSVGFSILAPLLFSDKKAQMTYLTMIYCIAFLAAGFVTPALNQWVLQIGPATERGRYFACKDICGTVINAILVFLMGRQLDHCIREGRPYQGYAVVYGFCILWSVVDAALMLRMKEPANPVVKGQEQRDWLAPVKDRKYRPVLYYFLLSYLANILGMGLLATYQLQVLHLSHTFLAGCGIGASCIGIAGIWMWGRVADKKGWKVTILCAQTITSLCNLGWSLARPGRKIQAVLLILLAGISTSTTSMASLNLQYENSPKQRRTTYLGMTAALASVTGYMGVLLGSALQKYLTAGLGEGRSMALLFFLESIAGGAAVLYGWRRLPGKAQG